MLELLGDLPPVKYQRPPVWRTRDTHAYDNHSISTFATSRCDRLQTLQPLNSQLPRVLRAFTWFKNARVNKSRLPAYRAEHYPSATFSLSPRYAITDKKLRKPQGNDGFILLFLWSGSRRALEKQSHHSIVIINGPNQIRAGRDISTSDDTDRIGNIPRI